MNTFIDNQNNRATRRPPVKPSKNFASTKIAAKPLAELAATISASSSVALNRTSYNRDSMLSLDKELLDDPLKVAQYCKQIFNHVLAEEVN